MGSLDNALGFLNLAKRARWAHRDFVAARRLVLRARSGCSSVQSSVVASVATGTKSAVSRGSETDFDRMSCDGATLSSAVKYSLLK